MLEVSGFGKQTSVGVIERFFQSDDKTGAKAVNVKYNRLTALVEYADAVDLEKVLNKHKATPFKLENEELTVRNISIGGNSEEDYKSCKRKTNVIDKANDFLSNDTLQDDMPGVNPYEVIVNGINTDIMCQESITMFLLWASGDKNMVTDVFPCETNSSILVRFKNIIDYGKMELNISRRRLEDVRLNLEPVYLTRTIMVENVPTFLDKNDLKQHFQSKKSGGGNIESNGVELNKEKENALITFKTHEEMNSVCSKKHSLGTANVIVTPYYTYLGKDVSKDKHAKNYQHPDETRYKRSILDTKTNTIEVRGNNLQSELLSPFFRNKNKSGGDQSARCCMMSENVALVTFDTAEVAERVLNKQIRRIGSQMEPVEITASSPRKISPNEKDTDKKSIGIRNVPSTVTKDGLGYYLEVLHGHYRNIRYCQEQGKILVEFEREVKDIDHLKKNAARNTLGNAKVTIESVPPMRAVQVYNVSRQTTIDCLYLYFSMSNLWGSGGGHIERIKLNREENYAIIHFVEETVAKRVITKSPHVLNGNEMKARAFFTFLGPTDEEFDTSTPRVDLPKPLKIDLKTPSLLGRFLETQKDHVTKLASIVKGKHGELVLQQGQIEIKCTIDRDAKEAHRLCKDWKKDIQDIIGGWTKRFKQSTLNVDKLIIPKMRSEQNKDELKCVFLQEVSSGFELCGETTSIAIALEKLKNIRDRIVLDMDRQNRKMNKTIRLKKWESKFLRLNTIDQIIKERFGDVDVEICERDGQINDMVLNGVPESSERAQEFLMEFLKTHVVKKDRMSTAKLDFLKTKQCEEYIEENFQKNELKCAWTVTNCEICVYCNTEEECDKALTAINGYIVENTIQIPEESVDVLQTDNWKQKCTAINAENNGLVQVKTCNNVTVISISEISRKVKDNLEAYLKENMILRESITSNGGTILFIGTNHEVTVADIEKKYKTVRIRYKIGAGVVSIEGAQNELSSAKADVLELINRIVNKSIRVDKFGMSSYFRSSEGGIYLVQLGKREGCIFTVDDKLIKVARGGRFSDENDASPENLRQDGPGDNIKDSSDIEGHLVINGRVHIILEKGNMVDQKVDILVNSTKKSLDLSTGVLSKSILKVAGREIQEECLKKKPNGIEYGEVCSTRGYNIKSCAGVYHCVCKSYKDPECEKTIRQIINACLKRVAEKRHKSIAFPALGSGGLCVPKEKVAKWMCSEVIKFTENNKDSTLERVVFVVYHKDMDIFQAFENEITVQKRLQRSSQNPMISGGASYIPNKDKDYNSSSESDDDQNPSDTKKDYYRGNDPDMVILKSGQCIGLIEGELAISKVDVIVNSTNTQLKLDRGAVSSSLLLAAGSELQDECRMKYPQGLKHGEIAVTNTKGRLHCKHLYHGICRDWNTDKSASKESVENIIRKCLEIASSYNVKSMAFPALGTGKLGIPGDVAAFMMYDGIKRFFEEKPKSSIKTINVVVYHKDHSTINAFRAKKDELLESTTSPFSSQPRPSHKDNRYPSGEGKRRFGRHTKYRERKNEADETSLKTIKDGHEVKLGGIYLQVITGDITNSPTDAIINSTNHRLDLSKGAVARAISKAGGDKLNNECRKIGSVDVDGFAVTHGGKMQCKTVIHMDVTSSRKDWKEMVIACLEKTEALKLSSVAFPALGTGSMMVSPENIARQMIGGIAEFDNKVQPRHVNLVKIFVFQKVHAKPFSDAMQALIGQTDSYTTPQIGGKGPRGGWSKTNENGKPVLPKTVSRHGKEKDTVVSTIAIYSDREERIQEAEKSLVDHMNNIYKEEEMHVKEIAMIDEQKINDEADTNNIWLEIKGNTIRFRGLKDNVMAMENYLQKLILQAISDAREKEKYQHEMTALRELARRIQWKFIDTDGTEKSYSLQLNKKIEDAKNGKSQIYQYKRNGKDCEIDFVAMTDTDISSKESFDIIRLTPTEGDIQLPGSWSDDYRGMKMITVPLNLGKEYDATAKLFLDSMQQAKKIPQIKEIRRIQNPTRYRQYVVSRKEMRRKIGASNVTIERTLFHGTDANAIDNINNDGFNRSYCGKNATRFGKGVYFAVSAAYSDLFARPQPDGTKNMYIAKVLTGHYTKGHPDMVVPPKLPSGNDRYDTVVDDFKQPNMYVTFHDSQAYPEYLLAYT
ncbi:unnamed protein product [Owenia fusiformis]|uniref:Uncharacterized protein n=1 Tax=Owenia fusiformis TaxID=6347 RepID=A0A8J1UCM8_OWEFU|nr:unnamed protein product [Owenia fusiformis]